ncbi:hypothetical protein O0I10_009860 [Lichtheimia ornata]|uniref:20S-pre-rRNA D-site endonuclease NOB1 n=1 Tax=Lichtheimia ornata TaxID=688661 RepID=A0AAD7UX35_9FUNG|nr:uncharacterized protein O0I10_009860 [Lichtheimia ornata]KAJ8654419.1 hypothetical protein O0I10_009860 [Lichtheimia ornata]
MDPKIGQLVIDTNAIVHGTTLVNVAREYYTCPEVIEEIRSSHSRQYLDQLPFEIKIEDPTENAVRAVMEFSKKTGDFASLSMPDIKVMALTYTLEERTNGLDNIRSEPLRTRPTGKLPSAPPQNTALRVQDDDDDDEPSVDEDGWEIAKPKKKGYHNSKKPASKKNKKKPAAAAAVDETTEQMQNLSMKEEEKKSGDAKVDDQEAKEQQPLSSPTAANDVIVEEVEDFDEDDDAGWITPENVTEHRAMEMGVKADELNNPKSLSVACMTGDFAMQNVLLQMNLSLVSTGGHRITKVKNWVLRCHACFTVTTNMEKKFCPKCGNASLQRVSCSTNSKGQVIYHLKKNFQYNLRGTKYALPTPKGGRHVNNIVLREDQREYVKAQQRKPKKALDLFDPDFIPLSGKTGGVHLGKTASNMYGTDRIGFGRKNPNASGKSRNRRK